MPFRARDSLNTPARRRWLATALIVIATLTGSIALVSLWAERQALDTERWVETSRELLADEEIRAALARFLVDSAAAPSSPEALEPAEGLLGSPAIAGLWAETNRRTHAFFVSVIEERQVGLVLADPSAGLVLDLSSIRDTIASTLGASPRQGAGSALTIEVLSPAELEVARDLARVLDALAIGSLLVTVGLWGLAVGITRESRLRTLRACAASLLAIGTLALLARFVVAEVFTELLGVGPSSESATRQVWLIGTSVLEQMAVAALIVAALVIGATLLYGLNERRERTRAPAR